MTRVQRRWGIWLLLLVAGALVALSLRPIFAAAMTVKAHPILGSGSGSAHTDSPNWSGSGYVTRVTRYTFNFSGDNVTSVTVQGTKKVDPAWIVVTMTVTVRDSSGGVLATGSNTLPGTSGNWSRTATLNTSVYFHRIASVEVSFTDVDIGP
ncbi:MAG: hypothetical protein ACK4K2_08175, partial [Dehalococcoidia bacterium]